MITPEQQRRGMRHAIISACWGVLSQILVRESSVIILFAMSIGAGDVLSLVTTSLMDVSLCATMMFFAYFTEVFGRKRTAITSTGIAGFMILVCAASPWFGLGSRTVMVTSLAFYSIAISCYVAAWFPLLDGVVPQDQRGRFFGRLRTSWQTASAVFLLASGYLVGRSTSIGKLQLIVAASGLAMIGRMWHLSRIPEAPARERPPFKLMLLDILGNRPLLGFGVYLFCLYSAASATVPVVFVMSKKYLQLPDNVVVFLSALVFIGAMGGYFVSGRLVDRIGTKPVFLIAHFGFGIINFMLAGINSSSTTSVILIGLLIMANGVLFASASVAVSSEMMALSPANNKAMSIAFCFSLYSAGIGFSRMLSSFILGSGMLSSSWSFLGHSMTQFHSLFLCYGFMVVFTCMLLVLVPAITRGVKRLPSV